MNTPKALVAVATALAGILITTPASAAGTAPTVAASSPYRPAAQFSLPCAGGWLRIEVPQRSGNTVKSSVTARCARSLLTRTGYIKATLERRVGGAWIPTTRGSQSLGSGAYTKTFPLRVTCARGSSQYRTRAEGWIKEGSGAKRPFSRVSPLKRITC
ncbi:hypothetical protein [Rhizohabitans arisaemae]|uniref:hypothetical protein n=1 Tax=Rhizohabitans arisaemae TaxID=2720610 RepID=UPI0024B1E692|nr:hypothetical protein [Rhizohabitans arisaemae]